MLSLVRYGCLGLAIQSCICGARASDAVQATSSSVKESTTPISATTSKLGTSTGVSTCPSRTVNYITHTLAQQCLRSDWSRSRGNAPSISSNTTEASNITTTITTTSTTVLLAESSLSSPNEVESDSPLDNANFLSFEDWKKQNLAKAGQSGEGLGARQHDRPQRPPNVNALDALGEESEIDLDFTGFGGAVIADRPREPPSTSSSATDSTELGQVSPASQALRPRDAGKTCKQRTNYASFDCAATVLKSNTECKSASSVLVENKDSYMLNKCSASNKYFIVELCNDILVDTVVLANYEFFSSIFRTFRVSVSDRYPAKADKWRDLGTFEARNTREVQAFLIENPLIWARYLRIEFLTHYGSEYYCPVSLLRVHGTTMMEEFRNQEELARGEVQDDAESAETMEDGTGVSETSTTIPEIISDPRSEQYSEAVLIVEKETQETVSVSRPSSTALQALTMTEIPSTATTSSAVAEASSSTTNVAAAQTQHTASAETTQLPSSSSTGSSTTSLQPESLTTTSPSSTSALSANSSSLIITASSSAVANATTASESSQSTHNTISVQDTVNASVATQSHSNATSAVAAIGTGSSADSKEIQSKTASTNSTKVATSTAQQAQPSTQESFFKSISKRLQQLESNSTLSLQYIEEQSRILRDAFSKVEKRQISTTTSFLSNLNNTVMAELAGFRQAYDQLWQSTVIELEGQQEQHQREMTALSARLSLVVDELVWQKRMGIVQSTLLLLCLGLVLFARGNGSVDASLLQQVMARSQAAFKSGSNENSPAAGQSPVTLIRRKIWRQDVPPLETVDDLSPADSPGLLPSPDEDGDGASDDDDETDALSITALDDLTRAASA